VQEKSLPGKKALLFQANGCPLIKIDEVGVLWCKKRNLSEKKALLCGARKKACLGKKPCCSKPMVVL
jgi:hypothetical protein